MKIKPVEHYSNPKLPTKQILESRPELLKLIPKRWQRNPVVLTALAGLAVMISGCGEKQAGTMQAEVAPVFIHGEGRGSYGCKVINPPAYLTEDEARDIIRQEAKRAGIVFAQPGNTLKNVAVPVTDRYGKTGKKIRRISLQMDGTDSKRHISYEFVSNNDFLKWERDYYIGGSTIYSYDSLNAAKTLQKGLKETNAKSYNAVFYEPYAKSKTIKYIKDSAGEVDYRATFEAEKKKSKEMNREELRKQVRDFIQWLKAQGVL